MWNIGTRTWHCKSEHAHKQLTLEYTRRATYTRKLNLVHPNGLLRMTNTAAREMNESLALKSLRHIGIGLNVSQCDSCSNAHASPTKNWVVYWRFSAFTLILHLDIVSSSAHRGPVYGFGNRSGITPDLMGLTKHIVWAKHQKENVSLPSHVTGTECTVAYLDGIQT
jgi:hypothetical protein